MNSMEASQTRFRSISLPARLHQIAHHKTDHLQNINSYQIPTSDAVKSDLLRLLELYTSFHETKTPFPGFSTGVTKSTEELLADSVDLLDACNAIREAFQMFRETVQALQSALRRKGLDSGVQQEIAGYFSCRKKISKSAAGTLKLLKNLEQKNSNLGDFIKETTIRVFRSILGLLNSAANGNNSLKGWPMVSRLMKTRHTTEMVNEIGNVDLEVKWLQGKMKKNVGNGDGSRVCADDQVRRVQVSLQEVDQLMGGFEGGLELVMRQLVQTRVYLLNLITHQYL